MKTYYITRDISHFYSTSIEANSEEEAKEIAMNMTLEEIGLNEIFEYEIYIEEIQK